MVVTVERNRDRVARRDMMEFPENDQDVTVAYHGEEWHHDVPLSLFSRMSPLNTVLFYLLYFFIFLTICQILHFSIHLLCFLHIEEQRV